LRICVYEGTKHFALRFGSSMQRSFKLLPLAALAAIIAICSISISAAQTRKDFIQPGEELVYKVKLGFVKLGTVVMQTGAISNDGTTVSARMHFRTADIPLLHAETTDIDQFYTNDLSLHTFEEHTQSGDDKSDKYSTYDRATKTLTYSDEKESNVVKHNIEPYEDALGIVLNMRAWSGAVGHKYIFYTHSKTGAKPVTVYFTNEFSDEEVAALGDKKVHARILQGAMDMGGSAPLGADGSFTAYVSDDAAAVPVRIDMSIAIGSISLVLDHIKRIGWEGGN
jgi:hypothetical protein